MNSPAVRTKKIIIPIAYYLLSLGFKTQFATKPNTRPHYKNTGIDNMSNIDYKSKRTDTMKARKLVHEIVHNLPMNVLFSQHALEELEKDGLTTVDAWNVLKGTSQIRKEGEFQNGSYRYRVETNFILVVIAFWPDGRGLNIVTAWDKRKKGIN